MATEPELREAFLNGNGIHRILVWLLAGVAGEGLVHRQMIASDPRQAFAFLQMVRNRYSGSCVTRLGVHGRHLTYRQLNCTKFTLGLLPSRSMRTM